LGGLLPQPPQIFDSGDVSSTVRRENIWIISSNGQT
jgi:hypothetical protein